MPNSGLSLTYASYSSNKVLTAASAIYLQKNAMDQVFNAIPGFQYIFGQPLNERYNVPDLQRAGQLMVKRGGNSIDIPLLTATNATGKSYSRYGTFDTTPQEGLGPAFIDWRQYGITASLDGFSERATGGDKETIIDLLKFTVDQALWSLRDIMATDLWATSKEFTTDIEGFLYWLEADPTSNTVGNVDRSANTFWRNQYNGTSQFVSDSTYAFAAAGKQNFMKGIISASAGPGVQMPDAVWTTRDIWAELWDSLEDQKRYTNIVTADAGFKTLEFMGRPVYWDTGIPSGYALFTNRNTFRVVVHRDANFKIGKFIEPDNQDARTAKIIWQGNMMNIEPRRNAVHSSIT